MNASSGIEPSVRRINAFSSSSYDFLINGFSPSVDFRTKAGSSLSP
jgi:hypothetical protein